MMHLPGRTNDNIPSLFQRKMGRLERSNTNSLAQKDTTDANLLRLTCSKARLPVRHGTGPARLPLRVLSGSNIFFHFNVLRRFIRPRATQLGGQRASSRGAAWAGRLSVSFGNTTVLAARNCHGYPVTLPIAHDKFYRRTWGLSGQSPSRQLPAN